MIYEVKKRSFYEQQCYAIYCTDGKKGVKQTGYRSQGNIGNRHPIPENKKEFIWNCRSLAYPEKYEISQSAFQKKKE
jgi:hypothetical protein